MLELARSSCVFYEWVESARWLGVCCVNTKCSLKSTLLFDTSAFVCLFVCLGVFISSHQVKLGCLALVWVDCRKFCALFFVCPLRSFCCFFFFFVRIYFFPPIFKVNFIFPKSPILEFACWDSLASFSPYFALVLTFLFVVEVTAFCSKFSCIQGEPAQLRLHSSEFSVSIAHSSLLL
uniref:Uncharacterized protein n=1 Tax=Molossus molossus TaxID=27622 RepID=A0A7J8ES25_MOLMO|nr:hypothetical protein HJG59_008639 [Molossus molossus]